MYKKSFLLLSIILIAFLTSCSQSPDKNKFQIKLDSIIYKPGTKEPFTGTWKGETDSMKVVFDVVNGKKEGKFESFYPNGKLLMSGYMKNNRNVGEWKYFYDNGSVESAGIFKNDRPVGKWIWYYPDGSLKQSGYYNTGLRDSIWKTYDTTGVLIDSSVVKSDTVQYSSSRK